MSRQHFITDCISGMLGVTNCEIIGEGTPDEMFLHRNTELTYQVWLRGYNSKALAVRDELMKNETGVWADVGYDDVEDAGRYVCEALQKKGFLPKRPGD